MTRDLPDLSLEDALRGALRADVPPVPVAVDARMLSEAHRHAARLQRRQHARWLFALAVPMAAAALALVVALPRSEPPPSAPADLSRDLHADGELNILDAFALARAVERGEVEPEWDWNGDGRVDARDVETLARGAVSVPPEEAR